MFRFSLLRKAAALLALAFATAGFSTPVSAQATEEDFRLLNRILDASNSISRKDARPGYEQCVELGKEVDARTDMPVAQHLYFQAEIESCIAYAMNNGEFSDENGDACVHHFAFARLITESIKAAQNMQGVTEDQFQNLRDRLDRAGELGPDIGCKGDYDGLIASLPETDVIASMAEAGVPDQQILEQISGLTNAITNTQSEDWLQACRRFEEGLTQRSTLTAVELVYFQALIENCVATTMARGAMSDETGDVCVHHHSYAEGLAAALLFDKDTPFFNPDFKQYVQGELMTAMRQGPDMGCTQDYEALKVE